MSDQAIAWIGELVKNWGGQTFFALLVWAFLAQKIKTIDQALSEIKNTLLRVCSDQSVLHGRATQNEAAIAYLKGKLNGQHEAK